MDNKQIRKSSRFLAVDILEKIETKGAFSNLLLNQTIQNGKVDKKEINLLTEMVYGVLQVKRALDYQLEPFIKRPEKLENWVKQLLRISLYQLEYLDRIPVHAVVNEAVNIAKYRGHKGISGLVNGVLRNIDRNGVRDFSLITDEVDSIAIPYSLPNWMVERFIEEYGLKETRNLAQSFLEKAQVSVRVNTNLISTEDAVEALENDGFIVKKSKISQVGLICESGLPTTSELFKSGKITIQDESSMLVAELLDIKKNQQVLDACAAPGGKTTHIATYLDPNQGGNVVALDLHKHKVKLIDENAKRQNLSEVIQTNAMDARKVTSYYGEEKFDRILVDAPCSGLGLMRRKPDIRYTKTIDDVLKLQSVQKNILSHVAKSLKKGGRLVYSTCTILKEENEEVVNSFLSDHPEFEKEIIQMKNLPISKNGTVTLLPQQYGTDGFFIASLRRKD